MTLLLAAVRYFMSYLTFHFNSRWAIISYRGAFISAAFTYGIVVYKAYRARMRSGNRQANGPIVIAADENAQYLGW